MESIISTRAFAETKGAEISEVEIIRQPQRITVVIETSKPGVLIGAKGATIEKIGERLQKVAGKKIQLKIKELKKPEVNAQLIAFNVARQLKSKSSFRKVLKQCLSGAMRGGAQGIKIRISGRLAGAEMARVQQVKEGRIPLHTFRADIDYCHSEALTKVGIIGIKVWICRGEVYGKVDLAPQFTAQKEQGNRRNNDERGNRKPFRKRNNNNAK